MENRLEQVREELKNGLPADHSHALLVVYVKRDHYMIDLMMTGPEKFLRDFLDGKVSPMIMSVKPDTTSVVMSVVPLSVLKKLAKDPSYEGLEKDIYKGYYTVNHLKV